MLRLVVGLVSITTATGTHGSAAGSLGADMDSRRVNSPKVPFKLEPLRWGSVNPRGWIKDWALAGRHGAVSPIHATFANVKNGTVNGWRHGRPPSDGFWDEDSAYWIDGMTRLGLVLNDTELVQRVMEDFSYVISHPINFHNNWHNQHDLSPGSAEGWVRSVYSRGMLAYYDATGNKTVLDFLVKAFSNYTAADSQSDRSLTQIEALLEGHAYGGPESMVHTALEMMKNNPVAVDWTNQLSNNPACFSAHTLDANNGICLQNEHGVSFNEISKLHAMAYSWNGNESYLNTSLNAFRMVDMFDMQVHGVNSGDEGLNGISPNLGTETCDISDFTYSNEWLYRITGNGRVHGDRLEKAFHNAAPGAINRTFTGHVYYQSPNFVQTSIGNHLIGDPRWHEEWYHTPPCCTGNQARLLPNYIHHMWYGTQNGGLAATMYGPNIVRAQVGPKRRTVQITTLTDYPFSDNIKMNITIEGKPIVFELALRIPSWCETQEVRINGQAVCAVADTNGFIHLSQTYKNGDQITLSIPAKLTATKKFTFADGTSNHTFNPAHAAQGSNATSNLPFCVVERGSLTFALAMEENPAGEFGYAIDCDAATMKFTSTPMPSKPWDWPLDAPVKVSVKARRFRWLDAWRLPDKPVTIEDTIGNETTLELVPYGNAKVYHISMFPVLESHITTTGTKR